MRMLTRARKTPIAFLTVLHNKARFLAVVAGVGCSILLLFLQLGFYDVVGKSAMLTYDLFDFDAAVVSTTYHFVNDAGTLAPQRLGQMGGAPSVAAFAPVFFEMAEWRRPGDPDAAWTLVVGVRPADRFLSDPEAVAGVRALAGEDTLLADRQSKVFPPQPPVGAATELDQRQFHVTGYYSHGAGFYRAVVLTSDHTWARLMDRPADRPSVALVRFQEGVALEAGVRALEDVLPEDVQVLTKSEIQALERRGWRSGKPTGLMFTSGAVLAFLVGAVILYQVLQSEVTRQLRELATLRALGFRQSRIRRVVIEEGVLYALAGYIPAALGAWAIYGALRSSARVPLHMTPERMIFVFLLAGAMCGVAGLMAVRRLAQADPADLF